MKVNPFVIVLVFALVLPPLSRAQQSGQATLRFLYNPPREAANDAEPPGSSGHALTYPLAPLVASDQAPSISDSANPSGPTAEEIRLGTPVHTVDPIVPKGFHGKSGAAILGATTIGATIQMDGTLVDLSALGGDQSFEDAALDAVPQWRYTPATLNGKPVEAKVFIVFLLRHGEIKTSIEPDLPYPTKPRKPIEEQRASGELFGVVVDHVKPPKPIYEANPDYSEPARAAKYHGTVVLGLIVGRDGTPADVWVVRKLGLGLDQKAVQAVRQWKFEPGLKDGEPVSVFANVEVGFHLY